MIQDQARSCESWTWSVRSTLVFSSWREGIVARSIFAFIVVALAVCSTPAPSTAAETPCPSILNHKFANLMDEPVSLCQFSGKVLLIVNTASECGYTPHSLPS
jgi:glutathione peroxidase